MIYKSIPEEAWTRWKDQPPPKEKEFVILARQRNHRDGFYYDVLAYDPDDGMYQKVWDGQPWRDEDWDEWIPLSRTPQKESK